MLAGNRIVILLINYLYAKDMEFNTRGFEWNINLKSGFMSCCHVVTLLDNEGK